MNEELMPKLAQLADWLKESRCTVAFTGAGISTESGLDAYRTPGGVWARNRVVYFQEFMESEAGRIEYWRQKAEAHESFANAQPSAGHLVLARLEQRQQLAAVITQNIDGLYQDAGSREVLELHGTARYVSCLDCHARYPAGPLVEQFLATGKVPPCQQCGRDRMKHATVSFGQALPVDVVNKAVQYAKTCELFLALGSSLVVYPAADLPQMAARRGAKLVIINDEPTPLDRLASLVIHGKLGPVLSQVEKQMQTPA